MKGEGDKEKITFTEAAFSFGIFLMIIIMLTCFIVAAIS